MHVRDRIIIVTGGASGIGRALCRRFAAEAAERVVVADVNLDGARSVADELGGIAVGCDVSSEDEIRGLVDRALHDCGRIDVFVSNAGITAKGGWTFRTTPGSGAGTSISWRTCLPRGRSCRT